MKRKWFLLAVVVLVLANCSGKQGSGSVDAQEVKSDENKTSVRVVDQNLNNYFSLSEITFANPRAAVELSNNLSNPSAINLDNVSAKLGTQFNAFIEEGLEETWIQLKNTYKLNPPSDWVVTGVSKDKLMEYIAMARDMDNARILFLTRAHEEFYAVFRQDWAVFVQDPKGVLKN